MNTTNTPLLFSNSCGKLFTDCVVFATAYKETEIKLTEIKNVSFSWHFSRSGLAFIFLPLPLLVIAFYFPESDNALKFSTCFLGILFMVFSAINARRHFILKLALKNGESLQWNVWKGNQKDTRKFIKHLNRQLTQCN
ncbi:hypothetical protein ACLI1A_03620 [Flavobacterium sp. RHBU_3]|uniref:hypothetical protein n=1 Tax=Flavobacterium sp. RHBU_3 TaxID=3391184 RepID=UPI003984FA80